MHLEIMKNVVNHNFFQSEAVDALVDAICKAMATTGASEAPRSQPVVMLIVCRAGKHRSVAGGYIFKQVINSIFGRGFGVNLEYLADWRWTCKGRCADCSQNSEAKDELIANVTRWVVDELERRNVRIPGDYDGARDRGSRGPVDHSPDRRSRSQSRHRHDRSQSSHSDRSHHRDMEVLAELRALRDEIRALQTPAAQHTRPQPPTDPPGAPPPPSPWAPRPPAYPPPPAAPPTGPRGPPPGAPPPPVYPPPVEMPPRALELLQLANINIGEWGVCNISERWIRMAKRDVISIPEQPLEKDVSRFLGLHGTAEGNFIRLWQPGWEGFGKLLPGPTAAGWGRIISCLGFTMTADTTWSSEQNVQQTISVLEKIAASSKHQSGMVLGFVTRGFVHRCENYDAWRPEWGRETGHLVHHMDHRRTWSIHSDQANICFIFVDRAWRS
jgi:hypothetical protein